MVMKIKCHCFGSTLPLPLQLLSSDRLHRHVNGPSIARINQSEVVYSMCAMMMMIMKVLIKRSLSKLKEEDVKLQGQKRRHK